MTARPNPGSFRCLVCQEFVRGTDTGHCPRCAYVPPTAVIIQEPRPVWNAMLLVHLAFLVAVVVALVQLL